MHARDFIFWLQGYFEISDHSLNGMTSHQAQVIKQHLDLVFRHDPTIKQEECEHDPKPEFVNPIKVADVPPLPKVTAVQFEPPADTGGIVDHRARMWDRPIC